VWRGRPTIELQDVSELKSMSLNVREHSAGCIVTGKTGLTHTRTIVNDKLYRG